MPLDYMFFYAILYVASGAMAYQIAHTLTDKKQDIVILFINKLWVNSVPISDD